jgi:hypothetical protein
MKKPSSEPCLHLCLLCAAIACLIKGKLDGGCAVRINLPATFQFSPATSKSIDIPDCENRKMAV